MFSEALRNEVGRALSTDKLEQEIHLLVEKFWAGIAPPLAESTQLTFFHMDRATLDESIDLEEELGITLAKIIRRSRYKYAENLIYRLSVLINRDQ